MLAIENGTGSASAVTGASGTRGNSSDAQVRNNNPLFSDVGNPPFGFRPSAASYAKDLNTPITQYPRLDFDDCENNAGHIFSGAFNAAAQAQCISAAGPD